MKGVLVFLSQGSEEMEAITVIDLLRRAGIEVTLAGESSEITAARKTKIIPDILIDEIDETDLYDLVYVPGGSKGVENLIKIQKVGDILKNHYNKSKFIGAICAGPLVLHYFGILPQNQKLTSHPDVKDILDIYNYSTDKVVEDRGIITSRGAGTALNFALYLIEKLINKSVATNVAKAIVFSND
ncbi:MAG: DJ-1/PfpI family protein [Candidatus Kapabacteria bacterium]|nr:DJ-1/PfpI family protein [Candidatus Kapabacteria bacterium]